MTFGEASSLRAAVPLPGGGTCLMAGFPGLETGIDGSGYIAPEGLDETLDEMLRRGVAELFVLSEEQELPAGAFALLRAALEARGMTSTFLPIEDFHVPDDAFCARWATLGPALHGHLAAGGTSAICCQYGAGRSGLVIAMMLIERGLSAAEAIALVRRHFEEAVESEAQVRWLERLARDRPC